MVKEIEIMNFNFESKDDCRQAKRIFNIWRFSGRYGSIHISGKNQPFLSNKY